MYALLIALFVVVPLVELMLLLRLGMIVGLGPTILLVILTGVIGATLARRQGLQVIGRIRREMDEGRIPARPLQDGLMILVAAAFLVTPGLLTDATGFALLIPSFRDLIRNRLQSAFEDHRRRKIIDVEWHE